MKLFRYIKEKVNAVFNKQIDGTGLAVFRIFYSIVLLAEVLQLYYFRNLIFDKIPFVEQAEINFGIPILIWIVSILMIIFGLYTRFSTILNYLMTVILIGSIKTFEYHVFYTYLGINFLMIFMPVANNLSIDRLLQKLKYSNAQFQYKPSKNVAQIFYYFPILIGVAFVYTDSIFYKFTSNLWMGGFGMWLPGNLPMISHFELPYLSDNEVLIRGLGYITVLFEFVFIFLFWFKRYRVLLLLIGVGLHLGILIEFPIPFFALSVIAIYILMVPVGFWNKFKFKNNNAILFFYYDAECPLCIRVKIIIEHLDVFNKVKFKSIQFYASQEKAFKGISELELYMNIYSVDKNAKVREGLDTYIAVFKAMKYLYPLGILLQFPGFYHLAGRVYKYVAVNRSTERCTDENCAYTIPVIPEDKLNTKILTNLTFGKIKKIGLMLVFGMVFMLIVFCTTETFFIRTPYIKDTGLAKVTRKVYAPISNFNKVFFGITKHAVFMDSHFEGYNHIVSVYYVNNDEKLIRLPIIKEDGTPDLYIYGFNWVKWTFRVNSPNINQENLSKGIRDFSAFWATKNNVDLKDAKFVIKVKKIESYNGWEKGFYEKQAKAPWIDAGYVIWKDKKYTSFIDEIEKI